MRSALRETKKTASDHMSTPDPDLTSPGRMIGGMALMVVGLLILIPSGLCTAGFVRHQRFVVYSAPDRVGV